MLRTAVSSRALWDHRHDKEPSEAFWELALGLYALSHVVMPASLSSQPGPEGELTPVGWGGSERLYSHLQFGAVKQETEHQSALLDSKLEMQLSN